MSAFEATNDAVVEVEGNTVPVEQGERRIIPLNRLFLSAQNVRKVRNPETIPELAAMIEAQGLLYPLCVVVEKRKGAKGEHFGVVAGGRRLAALQWLVEMGRMAKEVPIECLVFDVDRAVAVSLTENAAQEAMHPADQLEAFKLMVEEGRAVGQIAAAFGVSALTVERRLKLANLAPMFIALFREGKIEQAQMQALALTEDHAQQVRVWESLSHWERSAHNIRSRLTEQEVRADQPLALFVGLDAYRAAGGSVRTDIFANEGEGFLHDVDLLNRLAAEKLQAKADAVRALGWKWVEAREAGFPYAERSRFALLTCASVQPSAKEAEAIEALEADLARIVRRMDELEELNSYDADTDEDREWTPEQQAEYEALEEQHGTLDDQLDAMRDSLREWSPDQKAMAGVVLYIGEGGTLASVEGLVRAEDRKEANRNVGGGGATPSYESAPKERAEFSAALCQSLTAHRTAAVAAAFTLSPKVALAALLHTLLSHEREPWQSSPLGARFDNNAHKIASAAKDFDSSPAARMLEQAEGWGDHLPGDSAALFDRLQAMEVNGLLELLARVVARAYSVQGPDPVRSIQRGFDPARGIETALGIDMADWWSPTPESFLNHVSKAKMIEAVTQACGAEAARPIEAMKKADAVAAAAALLEGKRWLPSTLQSYVAPAVNDDDVVAVEEEGAED
ncbi:ParB/RepB/Spo0J family partition protein [Variovorax sp. YR216]|uniref:ParB/RepB/Spo0J family partition protein n=1 Tax=Variovorax sp. YR216 TaxID=1882828 RepID=UPI000896853F|nr:ParB/RepB/Spo0J family partition protein [Variovorax sp. YR216]SEB25436.1 ParB family protein [Variovorax sp. YR216]